jgi:phosphate uptake regulator
MGGLVESQIAQAVYALRHFDAEAARGVMINEKRVNQMEVEIDAVDRLLVNLFQPLLRAARRAVGVVQRLQTGHLSHYLGYMTLVLLGGLVGLKLAGIL